MELTSSPRTRVGKYELGNTLGEGTFAKVKIAKNKETGESVAIKVIDKEKILKHKMVDQVATKNKKNKSKRLSSHNSSHSLSLLLSHKYLLSLMFGRFFSELGR
jgi:serine/threonine protein kinase